MTESLAEKLARLKAARIAAEAPPAQPEFVHTGLEDLDVTNTTPRSDHQRRVDEACVNINITEVYDRFPDHGWGTERRTGESIKISCPNPSHPDANPSCDINAEKPGKNGEPGGLFYCHGCGQGGTKYDMAAFLYGYKLPGDFNKLKCRMAEEFRGVVPPTMPTPPVVAVVDVPTPPPAPVPTPTPEESKGRLDWRAVLALSPAHADGGTTFIQEYCRAASADTVPEEFHLFSALIAVGLVAGRNVTSTDVRELTANFGVCFVARSGAGKSRATYHLTQVLREVWPGSNTGAGIQIPDTVYSGQAMVSSLVKGEADPLVPGLVLSYPVRALFEYGELSSLISGGGVQGSILKDKVHEVLDAKAEIQYESKGAGRIVAKDAFASIITTTQTKRVRDLLKKSDQASGFMNRFLFVFGTEKAQLARGKVSIDLARAKDELISVKTYASGKKRKLDWSADADDCWEKVFRTQVEPLQRNDSNDILTRLDLNLKRMILAFAINEKSAQVERHHVEMTEALITYLVDCYGVMVGAMFNTEDSELANWLIEKIRALELLNLKKGPENYGPTQADLRRYYTKKGYDDAQVNRSLKELMTAGLVFKQPAAGKRGRTTDRYYLQDFD